MRRDQAVSTVVGTLLVLAFAVGALTLYQLTIVPDLKEEAEARHMDEVAHGMADLDADVLRQIRQTSAAPLSSPVPVTPDTPVFVPAPTSAASLSFDPDTQTTTVSSPNINVLSRNGSPVMAGGGTDWQTVQSGDTIEDIEGVIGLRIKITDPDPSDGDRLTIEATDADGDYAGDIQALAWTDNPELDLVVQTREPPAPGTTIFHNHILSIHQQRWDSEYWIDAMRDLYWFDLLLADADKPATLSFTDQGLDAEYKITYRERLAPGLSTLVGAGQTIEEYNRSLGTGTITYETQNEYFPDQRLAIEHGALVREQADGSAFLIDPPFQARAGGGVVTLGLDVPTLQGDADTVAGSSPASIRTSTSTKETLSASAGELTLAWGTQHPQAWASFLEDELIDAGLTSSNCPPASPSSPCQFAIETTTDEVNLTVHGPTATDTDPNDPERDVALDLQRGTIQTEVQR